MGNVSAIVIYRFSMGRWRNEF